jgi:amino acid adenylation domain-containing protein
MRAKPDRRMLDDWFRAALERHPNAQALRVQGRSWSYADVDAQARAWASDLAGRDGGRVRRVGILAAKSEEAYVGLLAALYAGAAAVPLGPEVPLERNLAIAAAAGVDALVADAAGAEQLAAIEAATGARVVVGPTRDGRRAMPARDSQSMPEPPARRSADDFAYVLFTSGSTGRPKGVPISHANVSAFLAASLGRYAFGPEDVFSQVYELTFDLAMFDIFMAWSAGACVCALTRLQALDPVRWVNRYGVTVWHTTPSLVNVLRARSALAPGSMPGIRHTIYCGEPLPVETARYWHRAAPNSVVDNIYGPTELTIACTAHRWRPSDAAPTDPGETVPIGEPNPGMEYLMLDERGGVDPERGELCMTGPQMFRGYLDPANDEGRFVRVGGRLWYRTGDRVQLRPGVGLVHLGRNDSQVKLAGYRVELGEVEHAIRDAAPGTEAVAFLAAGPAGPALIAFVAGGPAMEPAALLRRMADRVPTYMLPRHVWHLDQLPLNRNGKIDHAALRVEAGRRIQTGP